MQTVRILLVTTIAIGLTALVLPDCAWSQEASDLARAPLDALVPLDPRVVHDTLPNGLVYYVRENAEPRHRAELRLVIRAGSVLEDEDQRGLAHLVEHMAFNGTEHFEKQELIDYLESIGMRFGPDVNAYTSFDETVYMLTVPTDSTEQFDTAFRILEDWSRRLAFDPEEVAKERPVVVEEWRLGRGARMRTLDAHLPVLFHGSRYAERLPIGKKEIIEAAPIEVIRRFYVDWYRPDLAAVAAVGDFDADSVVAKIREHFAGWEAAADSRPRPIFPVPTHAETLVSVATDPETTIPNVSVYHKRPAGETRTLDAYRRSIVEALRSAMLTRRYFELAQKPDPPFLGAGTGTGRFVEATDVTVFGAGLKENDVAGGTRALITEAERAERHGFAASELERERNEILRAVEGAYDERGKTHSRQHADQYVQHFLYGLPAPGPEVALELYRRFLPEIDLVEVDASIRQTVTEASRVVLLTAPDKEGVQVPTEEDVLAVLRETREVEIAAFQDQAPEGPLVELPSAPGHIVAERAIDELGVTIWGLSNGVEVVLKPTDFKDDEIVLRASSPGGSSLVADSIVVPASTAAEIVVQSGLGEHDFVMLRKVLAGKEVFATPYIGSLEEGFFGHASPRDMETLFHLVRLYFTAPRRDPDAFASLREKMRASLANRAADPEAAFQDTLTMVLTQHHPRVVLRTPAFVDQMDLDGSLAVYRDRFSDASDFRFVLAGAFDQDSVRPLIETWIASLPSTGRVETWRDEGIDPPQEIVERMVHRGIEPKSQTTLVFSGPFEWNLENVNAVTALADYLRIRLREELREDRGGTYGVGVSGTGERWPDEEFSLRVSFGADPERVEELVPVVFREIEKVQGGEVDDEDFAKIRETRRRSLETDLRDNRFWATRLDYYLKHGLDPREILAIGERIESLEPPMIVDAARRWIDSRRYVRVTLLPESDARSSE